MAQMANDNSLQHQPIHGDPYNHQTSGQHQNISQQIRQYLTQHYDASKKYLSLESMQKHLPSFSWGKSSCTKALFTECAQYADCKILSLRDNNLKLQNWMAPLFSTLQGLTHLDLSMNNVDVISALSCLSAISHQLEFILFEGNPFTTSYWPSDPTFNKLLYHNDVSRRYAYPFISYLHLCISSPLHLIFTTISHSLVYQLIAFLPLSPLTLNPSTQPSNSLSPVRRLNHSHQGNP